MKILHVIADLDPSKGGPPIACRQVARLMARRGHSVRIVTTDRGFASAAADSTPGLQIEALRATRPHALKASWPMRRRLIEILPDVDVVHLHSLYLFHDWAAGRPRRRFGKPYIVRPHGTLDPYIYRQHRWRKAVLDLAFQNAILRNAAGLHYTTREEWELARSHAHNPRGAIVYNGIEPDDYRPVAPSRLRAQYPVIGDRKVVLFLGRLSEKKGLDILVEAFAKVAAHRRDLFLVMAGPDQGMKSVTQRHIERLGIAELCLFTGMVAGDDKRVLLFGSDFFLLPSRSENFAITAIEAALCGRPIVLSDRVNIWHEFDNAAAARVAPPSADAFAAELTDLLEHPDETAEMAARGAALVRQRFTWDALAPAYEEMYATAASRGALPVLQ
jgi:glycosyltransferase involved in cell wall biosynthesis